MNIVIVGHFGFPHGSAAASRMRHFARGFVESGQRVWVITMRPGQCAPGDDRTGAWANWRGVACTRAGGWDAPGRAHTRVGRAAQLVGILRTDALAACRLIEDVQRAHGVDVVIAYSWYCLGTNRILSFCKSRRIPLVSDVVEWLGSDSFSGGRWNPYYWDAERAFRFLLPHTDGIIAISGFLERWFLKQGLPVTRVPAVIDPDELPGPLATASTDGCKPFTLTYLGTMIDRDGPMLMTHAVRQVVEAGHDVVFNVVGDTARVPTAQRARVFAEGDALLRERVKFHGRVSDDEVWRHLSTSDALIFTRVSGRASEAAFPTRLPEYLATGRPVIASDVSDIGEYLENEHEALVVTPDSAERIAEAITTLVKRPDRGRSIGRAGRAKCYDCFHYGKRAAQMVAFLEEQVVGPRRSQLATSAAV